MYIKHLEFFLFTLAIFIHLNLRLYFNFMFMMGSKDNVLDKSVILSDKKLMKNNRNVQDLACN